MRPSIVVLFLVRFDSRAPAIQHNCSVLQGDAELIRLREEKMKSELS